MSVNLYTSVKINMQILGNGISRTLVCIYFLLLFPPLTMTLFLLCNDFTLKMDLKFMLNDHSTQKLKPMSLGSNMLC
jgi:hypothetical protein